MPAKSLLRLDPAAKEAIKALQSPGQSDIYQHLVEIYIKTSEELLTSLKTADIHFAKHTAHSWRSSSASVGAQILSDICSQIEVTKDPEQLKSLIQLAEKEYAAVKNELTQK